MPPLRTYNLFISHAWFYSKGYHSLVEHLVEAPYFNWKNYSVPEHDPVVNPETTVGKKVLYDALVRQIKPTSCFLIISGMYAAHKYWLDQEIQIAQSLNKPIIGLIPWGQLRTPIAVQNAAVEMVRWNTSSIVKAIREHSI